MVINCDCGYVARGEDEQKLLEDARQHIADQHPDMVGKVTDEQLLSMATDG